MGKSISKEPVYERACQGIGRTFQNIKLFSSMTVMENMMIGAQAKTNRNILSWLVGVKKANQEEKMLREKAEEILNFIGMYKYRNEIVSNLAYGRQKMTELGRTIMTDPKLILLDEPAAGLNPSERAELVAVIQKSHEEGMTFLLIEHNMDVVMNVSDDISVLSFGRLIAKGEPNAIKNNDEVITAYLGSAFVKDQSEEKNQP